jgi:CBS domain-containing protein
VKGPSAPDSNTNDDDVAALTKILRGIAPFDGVPDPARLEMSRGARIERFALGEVILDAFTVPSTEVFVVMAGSVDVWDTLQRSDDAADERLGPGGIFGFSAMLIRRSVGPLVIAADRVTVAAIPASIVEPAFASRTGAAFLAEQAAIARQRVVVSPYSLVDDLIFTQPLVVDITDPISDVARLMTERGAPCAAVRLPDGHFGVVTDAQLRRRVLVDGLPVTAPAAEVVDDAVPTTVLGDSAAEALILLLDHNAEFLLVTDAAGGLRGIVSPRDFTVSPATGGVSIHEQVRRASTVAELQERIRRVPTVLDDLLSRQLASSKVITVYSAIVDTIVRRAIQLIFQQHPDLSIDAFTWLSLGSNGRREATPSSDIDSAVAFDDAIGEVEIDRYRVVFGKINRLLAGAGLTADDHGATAEQPAFARTNASWRSAAQQWLLSPEKNQGAIMTSLLVDGRPIHGDPGLPAVTEVFQEVRRHPGTMRLLMQESLSKRAKFRSVRDIFTRRETFDIKTHALLPAVNMARWVGLSVGSAALPTTERLKAAAGSAMLPEEQAQNLIEAFEVVQRLRLRYQIEQYERAEKPSDMLVRDRLSPIDRSMLAQAVHEIAAVQRRMDNVAVYLPADAWTKPAAT